MLSYNIDSGLWEWFHLGLRDFLSAIHGNLVRDPDLVPSPRRRARLYAWAMAIQRTGRREPGDASA